MPGAVGGWLVSEVMKESRKLCDSSIFSSEKDEQIKRCLKKYLHEIESKTRCSVEMNNKKRKRQQGQTLMICMWCVICLNRKPRSAFEQEMYFSPSFCLSKQIFLKHLTGDDQKLNKKNYNNNIRSSTTRLLCIYSLRQCITVMWSWKMQSNRGPFVSTDSFIHILLSPRRRFLLSCSRALVPDYSGWKDSPDTNYWFHSVLRTDD